MLKELKPAVVVFGLLTVLTGIAYPALIAGIAQVAFPDQAGTDDLALIFQQAAIGLVRKNHVGKAGNQGRIDHPGQYRQGNQQNQGGFEFLEHA